ncbi:hypothetical protein SDC9_64438 [bioreactor metagenome]|uniref:Uncharacterized protein n=1 Tax=bioreactor metagenome TaxID=1076179 RepID=A0A644XPY0_9ZZZZ
MEEIRGDDGKVPSQKGVSEDDHHSKEEGCIVVHAEDSGEELGAGQESTGCIHDEEHENDDRADCLQYFRFVMEPVGQELGDGDGVLCMDGVLAHSFGYKEPVQVGSHQKAYGCPESFLQTCKVGESGKAHQEPSAHVGCLGAEGRKPWTDGTTAEEVVAGGLCFAEGKKADGQHKAKVEGKGEGCD